MQKTNPYFVPNRKVAQMQPSLIREIQKTKHAGTYPRINLGLGELPFALPKKAQEANELALRQGKSLYSANAGLRELRTAIAQEFSQEQKIPVTNKNVMVTVGSTGALFIACETLLNPGDEVLIPALHYPLYAMIPETRGARVREYLLDDYFNLDVANILKQITPKTKLIILNNPSNPTGKILAATMLQELVKKTENFSSLYFLSDELYATCIYDTKEVVSIARFTERAIVVNGLSKRASMTGKRLGWLIAPTQVIEQAIKVQQYAYTCAPVDAQYVALTILEGTCDTELDYFHSELQRKRELMYAELLKLDNITFQKPQGAFYYLINISKFGTSLAVAKKLIESVNVITTPGLAFGKQGDAYLRLSFAGNDEEIKKGIDNMKGAMQAWKQ